jgi:hypothetical protein
MRTVAHLYTHHKSPRLLLLLVMAVALGAALAGLSGCNMAARGLQGAGYGLVEDVRTAYAGVRQAADREDEVLYGRGGGQ